MTTVIFRASEAGSKPFHYFYLEAYARALGVPSALILLISRIHSEVEDGGSAPALDLLDRIQGSIDTLRATVEGGSVPSREDIRLVIDAYRERGSLNQMPTPPPD